MLWSRNRSWSRPLGWNRSRSCSRSCTVETAPAPPVVKLVKLVIYRFCYVHTDMECIVQSTYCAVKVYAVYFTFHILYSTSICSVFYSPHKVYEYTVCSVFYSPHTGTVQCTYNILLYAVYFKAHILYSVYRLCGVFYSPHTVQYIRCSLQRTYCTIYAV